MKLTAVEFLGLLRLQDAMLVMNAFFNILQHTWHPLNLVLPSSSKVHTMERGSRKLRERDYSLKCHL